MTGQGLQLATDLLQAVGAVGNDQQAAAGRRRRRRRQRWWRHCDSNLSMRRLFMSSVHIDPMRFTSPQGAGEAGLGLPQRKLVIRKRIAAGGCLIRTVIVLKLVQCTQLWLGCPSRPLCWQTP